MMLCSYFRVRENLVDMMGPIDLGRAHSLRRLDTVTAGGACMDLGWMLSRGTRVLTSGLGRPATPYANVQGLSDTQTARQIQRDSTSRVNTKQVTWRAGLRSVKTVSLRGANLEFVNGGEVMLKIDSTFLANFSGNARDTPVLRICSRRALGCSACGGRCSPSSHGVPRKSARDRCARASLFLGPVPPEPRRVSDDVPDRRFYYPRRRNAVSCVEFGSR